VLGVRPRDNADIPGNENVSDELERWLTSDHSKTLGSLIEVFGERSFAIVFALLMALPALPLPTGGATHVLEVITMLLALELIVGRREIWLPARWRRFELEGASRQKVVTTLLRRIRSLERFSRPRGSWLFGHRLTGMVFGLVVFGLALTAFVAPPFTGLDTLPALGVVVLSIGILLLDAVLVAGGVTIGAVGVVLVVGLSGLALTGLRKLF
jgi:hypothetical protein